MSIAIAIVESENRLRDVWMSALQSDPLLKCTQAHASVDGALPALRKSPPDVVLLGAAFRDAAGAAEVTRLRQEFPGAEVIVLSDQEDYSAILDALHAGANGYLKRSISSRDLARAIREVYSGGSPIAPQAARRLVAHLRRETRPGESMLDRVSDRELEVLAMLAEGYSCKKIAAELGISLSTVNAHTHSIYTKLGVRSRTQAVVLYLSRSNSRRPAANNAAALASPTAAPASLRAAVAAFAAR